MHEEVRCYTVALTRKELDRVPSLMHLASTEVPGVGSGKKVASSSKMASRA
jgi:hypothetical protein